MRKICSTCGGTGEVYRWPDHLGNGGWDECEDCQGTGMDTQGNGEWDECDDCQGTGMDTQGTD
jgi:DnaJ-class molecular chaperone